MYRILNRSICFSMQTILHCLILSVVSMLQFSFKLCDYNTKITTLWHFFMVFPNMIYAHFISFPSFSVKINWLLSKSVSIYIAPYWNETLYFCKPSELSHFARTTAFWKAKLFFYKHLFILDLL